MEEKNTLFLTALIYIYTQTYLYKIFDLSLPKSLNTFIFFRSTLVA